METKDKRTPRTSSGDRGKYPRIKFMRRYRTGGNPNNRNRKWYLAKKNNLLRIIKGGGNVSEIKCRIWLDTNDKKIAEEYYDSLTDLLKEFDFELSRENTAQIGSWIKDFWLKTVKKANSKEVQDRLDQLERALELKHIDIAQAEVNLKNAEAIAQLTEATNDVENFSTFIGTLLFAKATVDGKPRVFAQNLTQEQLKIIKENPSLESDPLNLIIQMEEYKAKVIASGAKKKIAGQ